MDGDVASCTSVASGYSNRTPAALAADAEGDKAQEYFDSGCSNNLAAASEDNLEEDVVARTESELVHVLGIERGIVVAAAAAAVAVAAGVPTVVAGNHSLLSQDECALSFGDLETCCSYC